MSGKIFGLGLPDDVLDTLLAMAAGKRLRLPPMESKHNPLYRKRRDQKICQKYGSGCSAEQIAQELKLTRRRVEQILQDNGIRKKEEKKVSRKEQLQEYLGTYTKTKVAEMLGISRQRLYQILKEEGL